MSQSLSGWDGVFHLAVWMPDTPEEFRSQSLSGWDGVFHLRVEATGVVPLGECRNPFQGGMGFFTQVFPVDGPDEARLVAIPFRVGWGFSPAARENKRRWLGVSRNPFQGGMGFFTPVSPDRLGCKPAAAFRQPQARPPKTSKKL